MTKLAQGWLVEKKYDQSTKIIELYEGNSDSKELQGELKIKDYKNIEKINLTRFASNGTALQGKITSLTIINCPNLKILIVEKNELSKIVFEGDFPLLWLLNLSDNKLVELDVSKFLNLTSLNTNHNHGLKEIKGIEKTQLKTISLLDTPRLGLQLGEALTVEQQQKLNDYDKLKKQNVWLLKYLKNNLDKAGYEQILVDVGKI